MTSLAPNADLAVRHAVDAYIDGRLLPTFDGEAFFETRNSRYRLMDGVLFSAPDSALVGAELVGWLIDYVSRSEVVTTWRTGARAVLVDTRNDGVRGPQIVVTSATRAFRSERDARQSSPRDVLRQSSPRESFQSAPPVAASVVPMPAPFAPPPAPVVPVAQAGSQVSQSGSTLPPPAAPVPAFRSPRTLPPPPPLPAYRPHVGRAVPFPPPSAGPPIWGADLTCQSTAREVRQAVPHDVRQSLPHDVRQSLPRTLPPPPPAPRPLPRALPPPAFADEVAARKIAAIEAAIEASWIPNEETEDLAPTVRNETWRDAGQSLPRGASRLSHGRGLSQRLPPPPASAPFLLSRSASSAGSRSASRSHQRGMPLR